MRQELLQRERLMRVTLAAFVAMALAGLPERPHAAVTYPWCTSSLGSGASNCGFASYEQCMAYARGKNQSCEQNPFHVPAAPSRGRKRGAENPR
jgi:hypothetical protein